MEHTYTVSQVTRYIKGIFERDAFLPSILIKGEISNCKYHSSGHIYFTLKDAGSSIPAVMFKGNRMTGLDFTLKDGQTVIISGEISVYERDGRYQLYSRKIMQDGIGKLYEELEKRKKRFEEEGLFDKAHKKPIPRFPAKIGVVTAKTGAAIQDILNIAKRRNPTVELILYPAKVQGEGAAETVAEGIRRLDKEGVDIMIVGRGGGSIEDLWCFNEEAVARAIFACNTPIISAVGHEVDFTISDLVADVRAATPSEAAELAVPDIRAVLMELEGIRAGLGARMKEKLKLLRAVLERMELRLIKESPASKLREYAQRLDETEDVIRTLMERMLNGCRSTLSSQKMKLFHQMKLNYERTNRRFMVLAAKLDGLSPLSRLTAGYSYIENEKGENVRSISDIHVSDRLRITLKDGSFKASVEEV